MAAPLPPPTAAPIAAPVATPAPVPTAVCVCLGVSQPAASAATTASAINVCARLMRYLSMYWGVTGRETTGERCTPAPGNPDADHGADAARRLCGSTRTHGDARSGFRPG